ncbi:MAG: ferritin-like domain-containing protein [Deltaproteobacteria bacterium]|nr:ferritin-like domain-containing protein [Deltaproteobacteria bacterium]
MEPLRERIIDVDLGDLGLDEGAHLLVQRALAQCDPAQVIRVRGTAHALAVDLRGWARAQGHRFEVSEGAWILSRSASYDGRWRNAVRASGTDAATSPGEHASSRWGVAARGALVEDSVPAWDFALGDKDSVWSDDAPRLYAMGAAAQWDPATAVPWSSELTHPAEVEDAVVQVMTYLIENETAALQVPARFLGRVHPHYREIVQVLALQCADEARHMEVFTRRALLQRDALGLSTAGGQRSLQTLYEEPDYAIASFLLSVLGEGSFLSLLWFLHAHGPDEVTRSVAKLSAQDEARHVAFSLSHLQRHCEREPAIRAKFARAVDARHQALQHTAGLNREVFDGLVLLAAGGWSPAALRRGHHAVIALQQTMDEGRRGRLARLGFSAGEAEALSALHTRNFM